MSRFVVLFHQMNQESGRSDHYDLMIEKPESGNDRQLLTWELAGRLTLGTTEARRLANHRLFYLDHEGPVSGNRGTVKRILAGDAKWLAFGESGMQVKMSSDLGQWLAWFEQIDGDHYRLTITDAG